MSQKIKELSKNILKIFKYPNTLLIYAAIIFLLLRSLFIEIFIINIWAILIIVPFILIFFFLLIKNKGNNLFFSIFSIFIVVFIFLLQSFYNNIKGIDSVRFADNYNCGLINLHGSAPLSSSNFYLQYYLTNPYKENLYAIYNNYGKQVGDRYTKAFYLMESVNTLINTVQMLNPQGMEPSVAAKASFFVEMYNGQIYEIDQKMKKIHCEEGLPLVQVNFLKNMIENLRSKFR